MSHIEIACYIFLLLEFGIFFITYKNIKRHERSIELQEEMMDLQKPFLKNKEELTQIQALYEDAVVMNDKYRRALEFYADEDNYNRRWYKKDGVEAKYNEQEDADYHSVIEWDNGKIAREVL